jgi:hypothetical protein
MTEKKTEAAAGSWEGCVSGHWAHPSFILWRQRHFAICKFNYIKTFPMRDSKDRLQQKAKQLGRTN